jgi:alpha-L-rhamnosidase
LSGLAVLDVRVEHHRVPFGIGERRPRLSWTLASDLPDGSAAAYEIQATNLLDGASVTSGLVRSADQVLVPWPFEPLASRDRRRVRVRVWCRGASVPSAWSDAVDIEAGLLDARDWVARMVSANAEDEDLEHAPAMRFRREFDVRRPVMAARMYVTAQGLYETGIDGTPVGDHVLAPVWTSYPDRLRYQAFDVTEHLPPGRHALGVTVADGWFRGRIGFRGGRRAIYGSRRAILLQLEVSYEDGSTDVISSDDRWRADPGGPIRATGIYEGETYDARLADDSWARPGFDEGSWRGVREEPFDPTRHVAASGPPVRRTSVLAPSASGTSPSGRRIVDFGQNLVGRVRLEVTGPAGAEVALRHAEILQDGELCTRPLRGAAATDHYIVRGDPAGETWEPTFTFHGFRYAEVTSRSINVEPDVRAVVIHSDLERVGWFACSDPDLERLHDNVVWSMRGNFVDLPTDCPQRDERLGWTGDLQVFAPTATFLYRCGGFLTSWLRDLAVEQRRFGTVPFFVPFIDIDPIRPLAGWGDAAVIVPWVMYERYGDVAILADQFESMAGWVDHIATRTSPSGLWDADRQIGDWLDPAAPPDHPDRARTDPNLIATAYHAHSARIVADAAAVLGDPRAEHRYRELAARTVAAFRAAYVTPGGRLASDAPTAYAIALGFDLLAPKHRERAGRRLVELVEEAGWTIPTGFLGTPLITDALVAAGATDTAYRLVLQDACPSWLYAIRMGATTTWERWDSLLPDGTVNPGQMTSFNHYAFGAVADWLHRNVAGLAPAAPGYRRLRIQPRPGGGLRHASASHLTPYGRAEVSWQRAAGSFTVEATVPHGASAVIVLPQEGLAPIEVGPGRHAFSCSTRSPEDDPVARTSGGAGSTGRCGAA